MDYQIRSGQPSEITIKGNPDWKIKKPENVSIISKEKIPRLHKILEYIGIHRLIKGTLRYPGRSV